MDDEPHRRAIALEEVRAKPGGSRRSGGGTACAMFGCSGSVARGEADEGSDLDLRVEAEPWVVGMFALSAFAGEVEDLFGVETQVVTLAGLKARIRPKVVAEAVPL